MAPSMTVWVAKVFDGPWSRLKVSMPMPATLRCANHYMIENMANLNALPPTGATVVIGVLPVRNGSQAQARIFALLP